MLKSIGMYSVALKFCGVSSYGAYSSVHFEWDIVYEIEWYL